MRNDYHDFIDEIGITSLSDGVARFYFNFDKLEPLPDHLFRRESLIEGDGLFSHYDCYPPLWEGGLCTAIGVAYRKNTGWTQIGMLLNHAHASECNALFVKKADGFHVIPKRPIKAGDEITVDYRQVRKELFDK